MSKAMRVESPQHLRAAVEEALAHSGPALVEVMSARRELIMPPTTAFDEARTLLKAVLDGRAGESIEVARVNLKR
jgi:pyruvate dehydrogenase (quinone)